MGLHPWLPDAMEGPTPVSSLLHAATMVTAGVFLVVRSSALFESSSMALLVVSIMGGFTAFSQLLLLWVNMILNVLLHIQLVVN